MYRNRVGAGTFSTNLLHYRFVRSIRRQVKTPKGEVGRFETPVEGAAIVCLRRRRFGDRELVLPEHVDGVGLFDAGGREMGVHPAGRGVAFLRGPISL